MPAKNSIKEYLADSFYHLYNRGVEKRNIFLDNQDYGVFLSYLKEYLSPKDLMNLQVIIASKDSSYKEKDVAIKMLARNNFFGDIELHCFSLLPNHFHLLVKQHNEDGIDRFLNSLGSRYTKFFNNKYHRVGKLVQGVYKAVRIESDEQLLYLTNYIHLNPFKWLSLPVSRYNELSLPSSIPEYLGVRHSPWISSNYILSYFAKENPNQGYFNFINRYYDPEIIAPVALDFEEENV